MRESRDQLSKEYGLDTDYLRLRAYPFSREVHEFVASHDRIYVIEQNRDAQMLSLLKLDLQAEEIVKLRSIRHFNGLPIDARSVTDDLVTQEEFKWQRRPLHLSWNHRNPVKRTALDCRSSTTVAARQPFAQVVATMQFLSASLTPFTRWVSSRSG
jgi:hypothetical protein